MKPFYQYLDRGTAQLKTLFNHASPFEGLEPELEVCRLKCLKSHLNRRYKTSKFLLALPLKTSL